MLNRRVGQNKHAENSLKNIKRADQNKAVQGGFFFLKINKPAGQIPIHMQYATNMQRGIFSQNQ